MADDQTFHDDIEGYCTPLSCQPGETVSLRVSTRSDRYHVTVERWGAQREVVWSTQGVAGEYTAPPPDADSNGCDWPVAVEIPVDDSWRSGFHLVTLTAVDAPPGRDVAHACFVVRAGASSSATSLLVLDTNTWNAYNTWGGCSLYTGGSRVSFDRPFGRGMLCRPEVDRDDRKARPVRWGEEPDPQGHIFQAYRTEHAYPAAIGSCGWFTHARRFVEWAERAGHEFDYAVSSDLEREPATLDPYDVVISVGHDEYWSAGQRDSVEAHVRGGGDFVSFSGNTMFWQVRIERNERSTNMVCHKYRAHIDDPVVEAGEPRQMTGMWADPLVGRPESSFLGAGSAYGLYHRFGNATARGVGGFVVYRGDHWLLADTGLRYGDVLGAKHGVVGYETVGCPVQFDEFQLPVAAARSGLPLDIEIVAFVPSSNLGVGDYPTSISALSDQGDLEFIAERLYGENSAQHRRRVLHGNSVLLTCRPFGEAGGEVVTVGTTDWVFGLIDDAAVQQVTANALRRRSR
ncbi:MAG: N,N-dimethylformamidase beta subunit family domain-containing protein [Ilumatobacteraceae bacterium]